jgi:starvation-inducible DNA-binding protein
MATTQGQKISVRKANGRAGKSATPHVTKNDLPQRVRAEVITVLHAQLADAIDLRLQAKQAHWTVKGPNFIALHELFDRVAGDVDGYADEIAERIQQLGGHVEGTAVAIARRSTLAEYPIEIFEGRDHVRALSTALASFAQGTRGGIERTTKLEDQGTADLLTEVARGVDKLLWFVEAHAQAKS